MSKKVLIIDIGNTATEFAVFEDGKLVNFLGDFKLPSQQNELEKKLDEIRTIIDDGMIFSVVPKTEKLVSKIVRKICGLKLDIFDWKNYVLKNKSSLITEPIGSDLLADLIGAEKEYGGPCIVADLGTITKLLLMDDNSTFVGLSLIPGIEKSLELFNSKAALLPKISEAKKADKTFGLNSIESMQHGIHWSTFYYIKGLLESVDYKKCKLILTGGNSRFIETEFKDAIIDKNLTLKGMYLLYLEVRK